MSIDVSTKDLDLVLDGLVGKRSAWARLPIPAKVALLGQVRRQLLAQADRWVSTAVEARGLDPGRREARAEEWLGALYPVASWLTDVIGTLTRLDSGQDVLAGLRVTTRESGQVVVRVVPADLYERLLFHGLEVELWMAPQIERAGLADTVAPFYRVPDPPGRVALVLGAGNVNSIPVLDALYSMVNDGDVVLLKLNPINAYLYPILEQVLAPLIRPGYLALTSGDATLGQRLCNDPRVQVVRLTGSRQTYDAIMWGTGPDRDRRRAGGHPLLDKPVLPELGGAGGTIVVPGPWSDADIRYQAEHIATQKLTLAGHTCVAAQVLILPQAWPQTPRLVDAVRDAMTTAWPRPTYYPRADDWHEAIRAAHPQAEQLACAVPRTLVVGVDPDADSPAFGEEFFGPVLATTSLPAADPGDYLDAAVRFANERLTGNLGVNLIIHPETMHQLGAHLDRAIADLRYGGVGINVWTALSFLLGRAAWGAYPGGTPQDIGSGAGVVHNALLLDSVQKSVARGPFRPFPRSVCNRELAIFPKPPWFIGNRTAATTGRLLTQFAAGPRPDRLPAIFASALRG